jgi:hypothetical protein
VDAEGHETLDMLVTPAGGVPSDHVPPPLLVSMTDAIEDPSPPTATHVVVFAEELGAHDTARTLTAGEN